MDKLQGFWASCWVSVFLVLPCLLVASNVSALSPDKKLHHYVLRTLTAKDGLPNNVVSSVCQTDDGYLWLGTQEGLVRFDGRDFRVYSSATNEEFGSNWIWKIKKDPKGRLWIATYNAGVLRYENEKFTTFRAKDGLVEENVRDFVFDKDGSTWVGTKGKGLFRFDADDRITNVSKEQGLCGDQIMSLAFDGDDNLWAATLDGGVCVRKNGKFQALSGDAKEGVSRALALARGLDGKMWVGSLFGLFRVVADRAVRFTHPKMPEDGVRAIYQDVHKNFWIGFVKKGLCVLRPTGDLECDEKGGEVGYEGVLDFFELSEDQLFVGCGAALRSLENGDVTTYTTEDGLPVPFVRSVLADSKGGVWFGTTKGARQMTKGSIVEFPQELKELSDLSIVAMYEDGKGRVWFGTEQQGIYHTEPDGTLAKLDESLFTEQFDVYNIVQLGDKIVFGTLGMGLKIYDGTRIYGYRESDGLPSDVIWSLSSFEKDSIVVGTNKGIVLFDGEKFHPFPGAEEIKDDMILALLHDDDGTLYIGTHGEGLVVYQDEKLRRIRKKDGLPTSSVFGIAVGADENVWLSADNGIVKVPREGLRAVFEGSSSTFETRSYGVEDGMLSEDCVGGQQYGLQMTESGEIFVATIQGVSMLDTTDLKSDDAAPIIHIEQFLVDGEENPLSGTLVLKSTVKNLEIHYTGISFHDGEGVRFRYRLHGYDSDWQDVGERRVAYYTNLGPGKYRFEVSGANRFGPWSSKDGALEFEKTPHFTQTPTFYILCALAFLLVVGAGVKLRLRALTLRAKLLDRKVKERTKALEKAHAKIVVLEKEALERQMAGGFAHEIRNALAGSKLLVAKLLAPDGKKDDSVSVSVSEKISQILIELLKKLKSLLAKDDLLEVAPLLKEVNNEQRKIDEYLRKTYGSIERCMRVTDDILDYSQAGQRGKGDEEIQIDGFLEALKEKFQADFPDAGVALELDSRSGAVWRGSSSHLQSVVWSLVINAKEALEERGREGVKPQITVHSSCSEDGVTIAVSDNGPGISIEVLEKIFEPFVSTKPESGVGLGLSLCRKFARLYGGELRGENKDGDERGAVFTLVLPFESKPSLPPSV